MDVSPLTDKEVKFSEVKEIKPDTSGIYQIYAITGEPLKVGISKNLRHRLVAHGKSRDSGLRLKQDLSKLPPEVDRENLKPADVVSKASILAKHLFFDGTITRKYDLKTEDGRRKFLENCCYVHFFKCSLEKARELEKEHEEKGGYRYKSKVELK